MRKLIASSLATLMTVAALAAPALGEPEKKTELVQLGKSVDRLQLRYSVDSVWVVDNQNILYRDTYNDHYLVTTKGACDQLIVRGRGFSFHPGDTWELLTTRTYEVRPEAGAYCDVGKIEQVDDAKAKTLRAASERRVW